MPLTFSRLPPLLDPSSQHAWPPKDPYKEAAYTGPAHDFSKDESPWTFGNETLNPSLKPSNSYRRSQNARGRSNVPPYHPDYQEPESSWVRNDSDDERHTPSTPSPSSSREREESDEMDPWSGPRVRRGSEGFEVREQTREEILRRYIESRGEEAGRYRRYAPEPDSGEEDYEKR